MKNSLKKKFEAVRTVCQDGIVRYPLLATEAPMEEASPSLPIGRLGKKPLITVLPLTRSDVDEFEEIWQELYSQYFGERARFFGKKKLNKVKLETLSKILAYVKQVETTLRLFLKAQFEESKQDRSCLILNQLASSRSMEIYLKWMEQFPNKKDAIRNATPMSLKETLVQDHRRYLAYKKMLWSDSVIFRNRFKDFSHFYLFASEEFLEFWEESDSIPENFRESHGRLWNQLAKDPMALENFFDLVRTVKCEVETENLILVSR